MRFKTAIPILSLPNYGAVAERLLAAEAPPVPGNAQDSDMFSPDVRERIAAARARTRTMSEAFSVQGFWRSDAWVTEDLMSLEGVTRN